MKSTAPIAIVFLSLLVLALACGGGDQASQQAEPTAEAAPPPVRTEADEPPVPGRQAIPEDLERGTAQVGYEIVPRFDVEGKVSSRAVAVGDVFELYICAQHPHEEMASATFAMTAPDGIEILGEKKMYLQSLSLGSYEQYFIVSYPCRGGDEPYPVIMYTCRALDSFAGGEFTIVEALPVNDMEPPFLGFVTCTHTSMEVPAMGGVASLKLK